MIDSEVAFVSICFVLFVSTLLIAFSFRKKKMGTDIWAGKGIIADESEVVRFINGKNKKLVIKTCQEFYDELRDQYIESPDEWRKQLVEDFDGINNISTKATIAEIRRALQSIIKVEGEVSKYGDCYVEHSEYLIDLFNKLFAVCDLDIPYLEDVVAFGSARYNGWDVPLGVACFVFSSDQCFVRTLSEEGKNLKKMIGHCEESEWTDISY
jgi:hypothetical protein